VTLVISAEIDGRHVPLDKCDWVLWGPCGCPFGVTVGALRDSSIVNATEESAWKSFYDRKRDIERAQKRGEHMELMTHERWCAEVAGRMKTRCAHGEGAA
jgi:hypothetical protein